MSLTVPAIGRFRYRWWRLVWRHISRWLDRRWEASHPFPIHSGCGPFSHPESLWHECDGHEWERFDWPYGRATKRGYRADRITRCRKCGAPRCDSYLPLTYGESDALAQAGRCTWERHHREAHEFLSGDLIEVGA